jgi:hypothetical protein
MARKTIERDNAVEVLFTPRERDLVRDHTFAGPNLTKGLKLARVAETKLAARYTLDDLDELIGYVAAEVNHTEDLALQAELDALYQRLKDEMESYDDGEWQEGV